MRKSNALRNLSHSANDLFWFILPLILPLLLVRYNLSYTRAGGILTFYLAITAVGSYFMGRISGRIPRRLIMSIGFYIAATGLIAAGFAGTFPVFMIFLAITAFGVSTFHPVMYAHIDETFGNDKGKVLGTYEASGAGALLIMFLVNGALLGTIGTRGVLVITAMPALVMGTLLIRARMMDASPAPGISVNDSGTGHASPALFFLFLPTIFTNHFDLPADRAAGATGLIFAGGIAGTLIASRFSRPDRSYRILIIGSLILAPLIAALALDVHLAFHFTVIFILGSIGSGLIINQNLLLTSLGSRFGKGEAFGILIAVMTLSQSVSPALFGMSIDKWGFAAALVIFSLPVIISAGLLMILSRRILGSLATQTA